MLNKSLESSDIYTTDDIKPYLKQQEIKTQLVILSYNFSQKYLPK